MSDYKSRTRVFKDSSHGWNHGVAPITQYFIEQYYKCVKVDNEKRQNGKLGIVGVLRWTRYALKKLGFARDGNVILDKMVWEKQNARSYDDWLVAAIRIEEKTQKEGWKEEEETSLYDWALVKYYTGQMREARVQKDWRKLLYIIRTTWVRNLGNMGNVNLYRHSHVGTKYLIEEYLEESKRSLHELVCNSNLNANYLLGTLIQTRKNIGRTALVLSGGGTFGLFHIGVLSTLFEQDLLPRVISGSSAGAIVASIMCVHKKHELMLLVDKFLKKDFNIFQDDSQKLGSGNLLIKLSRLFKNGTLFSNKELVKTMIDFLRDLTFREAYNSTGKILSVTVSPATLHEQPRLLNYLTAPNVLIWSAVCASCSLPGIFPSSHIYEKDPKTGKTTEWNSSSVKFVDGSVANDLPISKLSEMFNVDHIIACQVNIHVFPFLKFSLSCVGGEVEDEFSARLKQRFSTVYNYALNEVTHILELGSELGVARNLFTKLRSVLSQQYSGDITILPNMQILLHIKELLKNPTREFILREAVEGARATWPKISIIKNHCGQEFELDRAINYLKGKVISDKSPPCTGNLQLPDNSVSLINSPLTYHPFFLPLIQDPVDFRNLQTTDLDKESKRQHGGRNIAIHASRTINHFRRNSESSPIEFGSDVIPQPRSASCSPYISETLSFVGHCPASKLKNLNTSPSSTSNRKYSALDERLVNNYTTSEFYSAEDDSRILDSSSKLSKREALEKRKMFE